MPDYNIYIHAIGSGNANYNPTMPWSARDNAPGSAQTTPQSNGGSMAGAGSNAAKAIMMSSAYMQNPDSILSQSFTSISKAFPIAAAAYAVVKLGVAVIDTAIEFNVMESGDYRVVNNWQDTKRFFSTVLHPFSSTIEAYKMEKQWQQQNKRQVLERDLLGNSFATNRGV